VANKPRKERAKMVKYSKKTEAWIAEVARKNGMSRREVLRYFRELFSSRKVLSHPKIF